MKKCGQNLKKIWGIIFKALANYWKKPVLGMVKGHWHWIIYISPCAKIWLMNTKI